MKVRRRREGEKCLKWEARRKRARVFYLSLQLYDVLENNFTQKKRDRINSVRKKRPKYFKHFFLSCIEDYEPHKMWSVLSKRECWKNITRIFLFKNQKNVWEKIERRRKKDSQVWLNLSNKFRCSETFRKKKLNWKKAKMNKKWRSNEGGERKHFWKKPQKMIKNKWTRKLFYGS